MDEGTSYPRTTRSGDGTPKCSRAPPRTTRPCSSPPTPLPYVGHGDEAVQLATGSSFLPAASSSMPATSSRFLPIAASGAYQERAVEVAVVAWDGSRDVAGTVGVIAWDAWTRSPLKATKNPVRHLGCLFAVHESPEAVAAWSVRFPGAGAEPHMEERTRTSSPGRCCGWPVLFGVEGNGGRGASVMHALGAAAQQRWRVGAAVLRGRSDSPSPGSGRGRSRDASSARSVKLKRWSLREESKPPSCGEELVQQPRERFYPRLSGHFFLCFSWDS